MQVGVHRRISRLRPFETKRDLTSLPVDRAPRWARLCIKFKISRRNDSVTTGLTLLWDTSQRSVRLSSSAGGISTSFRIVIPVFKHCVSWSSVWAWAIFWKSISVWEVALSCIIEKVSAKALFLPLTWRRSLVISEMKANWKIWRGQFWVEPLEMAKVNGLWSVYLWSLTDG